MFIARFYGLIGFFEKSIVSHVNQDYVNIGKNLSGNLIFLIFAAYFLPHCRFIFNNCRIE